MILLEYDSGEPVLIVKGYVIFNRIVNYYQFTP